MTIESQCCSLELARRLKELGVKQESLFYYADSRKSWKEYNCPARKDEYTSSEFVPFYCAGVKHPEISLVQGYENAKDFIAGYNDSKPLSAFTVAELYELLPKLTYMIGQVEGRYRLCALPGEKNVFDDVKLDQFDSDTLVDCFAKALIHLKEQGIV